MRRREELLDRVGLGGFGNRQAHQLSGGQLQRVALARALIHEPSMLLLDEPFGALDAKIRSQLRRNLREIQRQLGVTAILVTHDQEEAFELAGRIGLMERGDLLEVGEPKLSTPGRGRCSAPPSWAPAPCWWGGRGTARWIGHRLSHPSRGRARGGWL